jgi:hypothetical protein
LAVVGKIRLDYELKSPIFLRGEDWSDGRIGSNYHLVFEVESKLNMLAGCET